MRQPVNDSSLARRIARALAVGFSVTALALNAWSLSLSDAPRAPTAQRAPARAHGMRPPEPAATARSAAVPSADRTTSEAANAVLLLRFQSAADDELSELAQELAKLADPRAHQALFVAARSARAPLRSAALEALAPLDDDDVRDFMLTQLVGPKAVLSVGYFADCLEPRAIPALERLARDLPTDQRRAAIDALAAQGDGAQPALERLLSADEEICDAVLDTRPLSVAMRRAVRRASIARVRAGAISTGSAFDFLEQDLARESRDTLVQAAHDPASVERALGALSARGDRSSLEALFRLSRDSDRGLAARAACTLSAAPDSRTQRFASRG